MKLANGRNRRSRRNSIKNLLSRLVLVMVLAPSLVAGADELVRKIPGAQQPRRYSPVAERPVTVDQMRTGSAAFVDFTPWAAPRFSYRSGMIAARYLDPVYMDLKTIQAKHGYFLKHDLKGILEIRDPSRRAKLISQLSPAEKYDLAVGDLDRSFSNAIWGEVMQQAATRELPTWYGVCDGTSAASILFHEPARTVVIRSRLGVEVPFYTGDIKALLSYSMTTFVADDLPIVGKRCDFEHPDPARDQCPGINPGSLHQIIVQMAEDPSRFPYMIVDRMPNATIWNSALLSASFAYYHPRDSSATRSGRADKMLVNPATVAPPAGSPGWAPGTRHLLFTASTLRMADTRSSVSFKGRGEMKHLDLTIRYILELNESREIIGGEWLSATHPSFIWALPKDYRPRSSGDRALTRADWQGFEIPDGTLGLVIATSKKGQPMTVLVERLYRRSIE